MMDEYSTPLLARPERFEFGILMKRVIDKFPDIFVDNMLGDVTRVFTHGLRTRQKFGEDVSFWASGDEETKIGQKGVVSDLL